MKIKSKSSWKKVKLNDQLLANVPDDFNGIEELTDYTLVKKGKQTVVKPKEVKTKTKKKKRTKAETQAGKKTEQQEGSDETAATQEEPLAKRVKLETEVQSDEENQENENEIESTFEVTPEMTIWKAMYLPDSMIRAVWELGFENPTAIQLAVLPTAMKGRKDIVGAAETGSGKTLAFGLPILAGILKDKEFEQKKAAEKKLDEENDDDSEVENDSDTSNHSEEDNCEKIEDAQISEDTNSPETSEKKLRALIITPTRELAVQIEQHLKAAAKYTGITMALVIGGMAAPKQERILRKCPDIVIGTPGRLWELISGGDPHLSQVSDIRYLALDETDRLLEKGHFTEVRTLLEHINSDESKKKWRQNFVFSATLTLDHELPKRLKQKKRRTAVKLNSLLGLVGIRPKAKIVDLTASAKQLKPASLTEMRLLSASLEDKDYYLYYFLRHHPGRTLVFCNSINNVRRLASVFTLLQLRPLPLHAQMQQKQRLKNLERFSRDENSLMIATDVAARGLDIPNVQHVVHFQVPRSSENYVHRSGRTARASRDGLSLMLIEPGETALYRQLCATLKKQKNDLPDYDVDMKVLAAVKIRVNLAKEIELLEHRMKKSRTEESWVQKMADEAELVVDDDRLDEDDEADTKHQRAQLIQQLKWKRKELEKLLLRPLKRTKS